MRAPWRVRVWRGSVRRVGVWRIARRGIRDGSTAASSVGAWVRVSAREREASCIDGRRRDGRVRRDRAAGLGGDTSADAGVRVRVVVLGDGRLGVGGVGSFVVCARVAGPLREHRHGVLIGAGVAPRADARAAFGGVRGRRRCVGESEASASSDAGVGGRGDAVVGRAVQGVRRACERVCAYGGHRRARAACGVCGRRLCWRGECVRQRGASGRAQCEPDRTERAGTARPAARCGLAQRLAPWGGGPDRGSRDGHGAWRSDGGGRFGGGARRGRRSRVAPSGDGGEGELRPLRGCFWWVGRAPRDGVALGWRERAKRAAARGESNGVAARVVVAGLVLRLAVPLRPDVCCGGRRELVRVQRDDRARDCSARPGLCECYGHLAVAGVAQSRHVPVAAGRSPVGAAPQDGGCGDGGGSSNAPSSADDTPNGAGAGCRHAGGRRGQYYY